MDSELRLVVGTVLVNYQWLIDDKSINQLFIYLSWLSRELCVFILFYESDSFDALAMVNFVGMVWASRMTHLKRRFVIFTASEWLINFLLRIEISSRVHVCVWLHSVMRLWIHACVLCWPIIARIINLHFKFSFSFVSSLLPPGDVELKGDEADKIISFKNSLGIDDPDAAAMHIEVGFLSVNSVNVCLDWIPFFII